MTFAVVLCWNDSPRVLRLLARLEALQPSPDVVVVVDNGSDSVHAERIAAAFARVVVVRLDANRGFAAAANRGIEYALSHAANEVWLLNTDVELPTDALALLRRALHAEPRRGMAAPVLLSADGRVECFGGGRVSLLTGDCRHALGGSDTIDYLAGACLLLRADMLRDIGLFDERYFFYWEDVDLGFRARDAGWTLAVAADCRVVHDEASTLGKWSAARWELLFRGMMRFAASRAAAPAATIASRLVVHSATMLRHGRLGAVAGAWRALMPSRKHRGPAGQWPPDLTS